MKFPLNLAFFQEYFANGWFANGAETLYYTLPLLLVASWPLIHWLSRRKLNLPPGPTGLPLVGYLYFLGKEPHRTLDNLKKRYGNVMSLYLGRTYVVVLADHSAVEDAYSQAATIDKLPGIFDFLPDGFGVGGSNGDEWVEQRRFFLRTMRDLGLGKTSWTSLVQEDISDFLKEIANTKGQPIDATKYLTGSITNNVASLVFGKRLPPGYMIDSLNSSLDSILDFFSRSSLQTYFPWLSTTLAKLRIGRYYKVFKDTVFFNSFIKKEVEEHRKTPKDSRGTDFISQYLDAIEKDINNKKTTFNDRNMIGNTQGLFAGAIDTTKASLAWLFLIMAKYPDIQKKVYTELTSNLGPEQMALWEDRLKFPYTYAVIMEGQRWRTLIPLNSQRVASEDIKICGYDIQKGTKIMANFWGLHNDPRYWPEPEKFIPERFLRNDGKEVNLKPQSYIPFSSGKRRCPGETVALIEIFLYFTAAIQRFEVRAPNGMELEMDGIMGLIYRPVYQSLCFIARS